MNIAAVSETLVLAVKRALVEGIAARFMPIYEATRDQEGYVSIQGDPFDESEDTIIKTDLFHIASSFLFFRHRSGFYTHRIAYRYTG